MANPQKRIYLSPPHMSGNEQKYINEAFETNWIAPLGPNVEAFEHELATYIGAKGALALSSGTSAIHLALRLLNVGKGDIVFVSTLTFIASANPILYLGAEPVFIDSEPTSWNMSPQALQNAFEDAKKKGKFPKAIIIVNLYGQSADMEPLMKIAHYYKVPIIEDAAESLGATYKGKLSGTFGKYGIFSYNGNKIITTSGGGMLISDELDAITKARFWATQARDPAPHYQHSEMGYNYRLSNILAGIGRGQLEVLEKRVKQKREVFERYYQALSNVEGLEFMPEASYGRSTRWLTTLTIDSKIIDIKPIDIINALARENIESRPVWKPLHLQPLFKGYQYYQYDDNNSISDILFENGICLPSGSNLSLEEQNRVIDIIKNVILRGGKVS